MADSDYVTINPTVDGKRRIVVVMQYLPRVDEYQVKRASHPLKPIDAEALARSWAAALNVEIRS